MPTNIVLNPDGSLPIPQIIEELHKLTEEYSLETYPSKHREHLGASVIGEKCRRKLFYIFRWVKLGNAPGRMRRLWNRGYREEPVIDNILSWMGFFVREIDPATDRQYKFSAVNGHFGGSGDGIVLLPWFRGDNDPRILVEKKTFAKKYFDALKNKGMKEATPKYWAQQCSYGKAFNLRYALFIAVCKDNDDIHYELNELDWNYAIELENKAKDIITATTPPEKISSDPNYFECKWCEFNTVCHWGELVDKNCRSCKMAVAVEKGEWFCSRFKDKIPSDFLKVGCEWHQSINE